MEPTGLSVVVAGLDAVTAQANSPPTLTTELITSRRETSSAERALGDVMAHSDEGHRALYQVPGSMQTVVRLRPRQLPAGAGYHSRRPAAVCRSIDHN